MSFLVLVITDFVQKALINGLRLNHPASDKYKLKIYYSKGGGKAIAVDSAADADDTLELPEDMPIVEAYFKYADKHICSSGKFCRKMLGLDGDPVRSRAQTVVRHLSSHAPLANVGVLALFALVCAGAIHRSTHVPSGAPRCIRPRG